MRFVRDLYFLESASSSNYIRVDSDQNSWKKANRCALAAIHRNKNSDGKANTNWLLAKNMMLGGEEKENFVCVASILQFKDT